MDTNSAALAMQVGSSLTSLQIVTACFPLVEAAGKVPAASGEEATLLRQLAAKQLKAERSARTALAASRRSVPDLSEDERYASTMDTYLTLEVVAHSVHQSLGHVLIQAHSVCLYSSSPVQGSTQ